MPRPKKYTEDMSDLQKVNAQIEDCKKRLEKLEKEKEALEAKEILDKAAKKGLNFDDIVKMLNDHP